MKPADLIGLRVISSPESTPFGQTLGRAFGAAGAKMHKDFECTSSTTACWFAQAGVGVAVVDQVAIAGDCWRGWRFGRFSRGRNSLFEWYEIDIVRGPYQSALLPRHLIRFCMS